MGNALQVIGHVKSDSPLGRLINSVSSDELKKLNVVWGDPLIAARITASVRVRNIDIGNQSINDILAGLEFNAERIARKLIEQQGDAPEVLSVEASIEAGNAIPSGFNDALWLEFDIAIKAFVKW